MNQPDFEKDEIRLVFWSNKIGEKCERKGKQWRKWWKECI